jgi:hypothetical protein
MSKKKVVIETKTERRGRPVKSDSARQMRLNKFAELKANGVVIKRGRPAKIVEPNAPVVVKTPKVKVPKEPKVKKAKSSEVKTEPTVVLSEGVNHKTVSHPTGKPVTYVRSKDIVQAAGKGFEDIEQDNEIEIEDIVVDEFVPTEDDIKELNIGE